MNSEGEISVQKVCWLERRCCRTDPKLPYLAPEMLRLDGKVLLVSDSVPAMRWPRPGVSKSEERGGVEGGNKEEDGKGLF